MINQTFRLWYFSCHLCVDDYHVLFVAISLSRVIHSLLRRPGNLKRLNL
jgi:hypothetical protein